MNDIVKHCIHCGSNMSFPNPDLEPELRYDDRVRHLKFISEIVMCGDCRGKEYRRGIIQSRRDESVMFGLEPEHE